MRGRAVAVDLGHPVPMLAVSDIHKTIAFYTNALECEVVNSMDYEGRLAWAALSTGTGEGMFTHEGPEFVNEAGLETRRHVILYFRPDDVVRLHESVRSKGFKCSELRITFYQMKEFDLEDPDGYQLWFGQETDEPPTPRA